MFLATLALVSAQCTPLTGDGTWSTATSCPAGTQVNDGESCTFECTNGGTPSPMETTCVGTTFNATAPTGCNTGCQGYASPAAANGLNQDVDNCTNAAVSGVYPTGTTCSFTACPSPQAPATSYDTMCTNGIWSQQNASCQATSGAVAVGACGTCLLADSTAANPCLNVCDGQTTTTKKARVARNLVGAQVTPSNDFATACAVNGAVYFCTAAQNALVQAAIAAGMTPQAATEANCTPCNPADSSKKGLLGLLGLLGLIPLLLLALICCLICCRRAKRRGQPMMVGQQAAMPPPLPPAAPPADFGVPIGAPCGGPIGAPCPGLPP